MCIALSDVVTKQLDRNSYADSHEKARSDLDNKKIKTSHQSAILNTTINAWKCHSLINKNSPQNLQNGKRTNSGCVKTIRFTVVPGTPLAVVDYFSETICPKVFYSWCNNSTNNSFKESCARSDFYSNVTSVSNKGFVVSHMLSYICCFFGFFLQEITELPDYNKITFKDNPPIPLEEIVPDTSPQAIDLLKKFLVYPSKQRISARQVWSHKTTSL